MRRVFEYLDIPQLAKAEIVCKGWKRSLRSNEFFWRGVYEINWTLMVASHPAVATRGLSTLWRKRSKNRYVIDRNWLKGNCTQQIVNYGEAVRAIQFVDQTMVTGGDDNAIQIWNMKSPESKKAALLGHTARIRCLTLNYFQRTKKIISGSDDKMINIWDSTTGTCQSILQGHTSSVLALASNEDFFISCSRDQTIRGWDLETGRCILLLRGHTGAVRSIDLLGNRVVSGSEDRQLGEWDLRSKLSIQTIRGHTASVGAVCYGPDDLVVSGSHDTSIRLWDFRYNDPTSITNQPLNILNGHTMWVQVLNNVNGKRLVSGSGDHTIKLWDISTGNCLRTYSDHYGYPIGDICNDGIKMVSGDWRGQVRIWNFAGLKW
jgi:WD40 repeat protein